MDAFLLQSNYTILYQWFKYHLHDYKEKSDEWAFSLYKTQNHANISVHFYRSGVIEQLIKDRDGQVLYYMHFQFVNFLQATYILKDTLLFIKNLDIKKIHILICCSCGLTSSLFQEGMQKVIDDNKMNFDITASDIYSLEHKYKDYDFILLTPQVHHFKPKLMETIPKPMITIPITDFACHHYYNIISIINNYLKHGE